MAGIGAWWLYSKHVITVLPFPVWLRQEVALNMVFTQWLAACRLGCGALFKDCPSAVRPRFRDCLGLIKKYLERLDV